MKKNKKSSFRLFTNKYTKERIEELETEILTLKNELKKEKFKVENYETLKKFKTGTHINADIIVSDIEVATNLNEVLIDIGRNIFGFFFNRKTDSLNAESTLKKVKYYLKFNCIDLKSNNKVSFNLEEIEKLKNI